MNSGSDSGTVRICAIFAGILLASCAPRIAATPLAPDGATPLPGAASGFRYFLPRPYLLVMEIPAGARVRVAVPTDAPKPPEHPGPGRLRTGAASPSKKSTAAAADDSGGGDKQGSQSPAAPGNTGFLASSPTYMAKLIYLPNYSQPMAVTMDTGLFGTASMQLTLQDGWMLTNVSANGDNSKLADVVTAALGAVGGAVTGGASNAVSAATKKTGGSPKVTIDRALRPGLYAFDYVYGQSRVFTVCAVAYFDAAGSHLAHPREAGACGPDVSRPSPILVSEVISRAF
jgi:hypothetical protein